MWPNFKNNNAQSHYISNTLALGPLTIQLLDHQHHLLKPGIGIHNCVKLIGPVNGPGLSIATANGM